MSMIIKDFLGKNLYIGDIVSFHIEREGLSIGIIEEITSRGRLVIAVNNKYKPRKQGKDVIKIN